MQSHALLPSSSTSYRVQAAAAGTGWACGSNAFGQLGDGTTTDRAAPAQVAGLGGVVAVAAGPNFSLAAGADGGTVWAWGANGFGQLGDGTTTWRRTPVRVGGLAGVVAVAAGAAHSLALGADGTVWAWGGNYQGELGDGTTVDRAAPARVAGLAGVVGIAAGTSFSLALGADGTVWAWGSNG